VKQYGSSDKTACASHRQKSPESVYFDVRLFSIVVSIAGVTYSVELQGEMTMNVEKVRI
jgi:hypothetical protein